jgi:amidase
MKRDGHVLSNTDPGATSDGRPVGIQITGRMHADTAVLRAAANFERARPWAQHRPSGL